MGIAKRRVLAMPRFLKPEDQCYQLLKKPPSVKSVPDRFFLLPPGKTWGNLPFTTFNLTDEDFSLGPSEPAPKGPDELVVDFELARGGDGTRPGPLPAPEGTTVDIMTRYPERAP